MVSFVRFTTIRSTKTEVNQRSILTFSLSAKRYDTMAQGPHGKMGMHKKFKTIYNSVMRAKNLLDHLIPDDI